MAQRMGRGGQGAAAGKAAGKEPEGAAARRLDTVQLAALEKSFRDWAGAALRPDVALSRLRLLCVFLLLRATGARLGEVLGLDERRDLDCAAGVIRFAGREAQLPPEVCAEVAALAAHPGAGRLAGRLLALDQGQVRRTFAERAAAAGLPRELSSPTVLRRSRAAEMLGGGVPLPVVQRALGQSSPVLTAAWHDWPDEEARRMVARFLDRERRRTSARNAFFGRVTRIVRGEVQALVQIEAVGGQRLSSVITMGSLDSLGLRQGRMVTAEIKAPWVLLARADAAHPERPPRAVQGADNAFCGMVASLRAGEVTTEVVTELPDGTAICAVITSPSAQDLGLAPGRPVWVFWSAFAVILNADGPDGPNGGLAREEGQTL